MGFPPLVAARAGHALVVAASEEISSHVEEEHDVVVEAARVAVVDTERRLDARSSRDACGKAPVSRLPDAEELSRDAMEDADTQ